MSVVLDSRLRGPIPLFPGEVFAFAAQRSHADCLGALYWPEEGLLAVADLHLEKGSSFARRGQLLPPYDTTETLSRLARLIAHYAPAHRHRARRQFP